MSTTFIRKPDSLADVNERLAIALQESGEPVEEWAAETGVKPMQLRGWINGRRISSRWILRLDDIMGEHFLSPPERAWAERATALADRHSARRSGR